MTTPKATADRDSILRPVDTENDRNIIEDGRLPRLRKEAREAMKFTGGRKKLAAILEQLDNPRLLDAKSNSGDYPDSLLEWAIREGDVGCARLLLATGADPKKSQLGGGFLPVHLLACGANQMDRKTIREFIDMLSDAGADFGAKDDQGWTPLHHAVYSGSTWFAEMLITRGAWVDPNFGDPAKECELIPQECETDHPYAVKTLAAVRRALRSKEIGEAILSAMPDEPEASANPAPGMTL